MSDTALVRYERDGRIAHIVLNRPQKLNAINDALTAQLESAFERFDTDPSAWVAVLRGAGRAFSAGGDVKERHTKSREEMLRDGGPQGRGVNLGDLMYKSVNSKPVIAACHGYAVGAALGLALECDLVIAEENTIFQVSEVSRGLAPARLWAAMRMRGSGSFANEVALTGRQFNASEAAAAGLINRAVPPGEHVSAAVALADRVAENPPLGTRVLVRSMRFALDSLEREMTALVDPYRLYLTKDFEEAAKAFVEKRKPEFRGE
jgi:enoyl-CoA hydratase/carnithine racemase